MTTTTTEPDVIPFNASRAWIKPESWKPGIPIYDPWAEDYGYSRSSFMLAIGNDHPAPECVPDSDGRCAFMGADAFRWYPDKTAHHKDGTIEPGPYLRRFYGATAAESRP